MPVAKYTEGVKGLCAGMEIMKHLGQYKVWLLDRVSLVKGKENENGLHSTIDHDCCLCVDATEVYMILDK
jgi:hypothetical protein